MHAARLAFTRRESTYIYTACRHAIYSATHFQRPHGRARRARACVRYATAAIYERHYAIILR